MAAFKIDFKDPTTWLLAPLATPLLPFAFLSGCGGGGASSSGCAEGETQQCTCTGADVGVQICEDDGTWGECECGDGGIDAGTEYDYLLKNVRFISAGDTYTCAVQIPGNVKCWGVNSDGQLGDGTTEASNVPVDVLGLSAGVSVVATSGERHTCANMEGGGVKCWGYNGDGQLGDGSYENSLTPVDVYGITSMVPLLSAGDDHTCAYVVTGGLQCWGENDVCQLGNGDEFVYDMNIPVGVVDLTSEVQFFSAGKNHTCALMSSGAVKCWGMDLDGQLGDGGTYLCSAVPVDVIGLASDVRAVFAGGGHTCALTELGEVQCWGRNWYGQLGDGTTDSSTVPVSVVGLSSGVEALALGENHTCALLTTGGVKCWGYNDWGQVGDGMYEESVVMPVDVVDISSGAAAISAGYDHTCALMITGSVKCWGDNYWGQLGYGPNADSSIPVDVVSGL